MPKEVRHCLPKTEKFAEIITFNIKKCAHSSEKVFYSLKKIHLFIPKQIFTQQKHYHLRPKNHFKWLYSNQVYISAFLSSHHIYCVDDSAKPKKSAMIKLIKNNAEKRFGFCPGLGSGCFCECTS